LQTPVQAQAYDPQEPVGMALPDSPQHLRIREALAKFFEEIAPRFVRLVRVHKRITTKAGVSSTGMASFFPL
jgi:hypothetical protein